MKLLRLLLLGVFAISSVSAFAESQPLPAELAHSLVQAKSVYLVTGHVRYYSFKHSFIKAKLVDTTPFDAPSRQDLEQWGRFTIVPNVKDADLIVRVYMTGDTHSVPVFTPGVTGTVDVGAEFVVLDVVERSSGKILWSGNKNIARSWSTKSAVEGLMKKFRAFVEQEEKASQLTSSVASGNGG